MTAKRSILGSGKAPASAFGGQASVRAAKTRCLAVAPKDERGHGRGFCRRPAGHPGRHVSNDGLQWLELPESLCTPEGRAAFNAVKLKGSLVVAMLRNRRAATMVEGLERVAVLGALDEAIAVLELEEAGHAD